MTRPDNSQLILNAFKRHLETVSRSEATVLNEVSKAFAILEEIVKNRRVLFICGNGGSAAQSQHFAAEWVCRYKKERPALKAIALTTDTSALTAIGNDYGFENIFARQVEALASKDDCLVVISTSGRSPNILKAIDKAKTIGLKTIALSGQKGAALKNLVDVAILVPSDETARIQEVHDLILHAWCEAIDENFTS